MQVREWVEKGFVLVDGLLPLSLIQRLAKSARRRFPAPTSDEAQHLNDFGAGMTFPDEDPAFNELTLHPRLAEAVAQLLTVAIHELRLTQSDLGPNMVDQRAIVAITTIKTNEFMSTTRTTR